jgi:hypothetical protein
MHTFKNSRQFLDAVRAMRAAQKLYFETRNQGDLDHAHMLEMAVDQQLATIDRVAQEKLAEETQRYEKYKAETIARYGERARKMFEEKENHDDGN